MLELGDGHVLTLPGSQAEAGGKARSQLGIEQFRGVAVATMWTLLIAGLVSEGAVRVLGSEDEHGTFLFRNVRVRPFRYSGAVYRPEIEAYLGQPEPSLLVDPVLGWVPRPGHQGVDGKLYDPHGIRTDGGAYDTVPADGVFRIVLVGDSYTEGAEVEFRETWGFYLEEKLRQAGVDAEVLNLGVGGYGIDQAYLRWRETGRAFQPDLVILGLQPENALRNVNVFRPFYTGSTTGLLLSKPRFVLVEDSLVLHNVPTIPPQRIPDWIDGFWDSPLAPLETFRQRADEFPGVWARSRLLSTIVTVWERKVLGRTTTTPASLLFAPESEATPLALAVIQALRTDVRDTGAKFMVLHLPRARHDVLGLSRGTPLVYAELLEAVRARFWVVDPLPQLLQLARAGDTELLHRPHGHYAPKANRVVANVAGEAIGRWLQEGGADPDSRGSGKARSP